MGLALGEQVFFKTLMLFKSAMVLAQFSLMDCVQVLVSMLKSSFALLLDFASVGMMLKQRVSLCLKA